MLMCSKKPFFRIVRYQDPAWNLIKQLYLIVLYLVDLFFFIFAQGSYGRLGLGDSVNQQQLKRVGIDAECGVKHVSSSKGSDGHTLAVTVDGQVYSWGDGESDAFWYF